MPWPIFGTNIYYAIYNKIELDLHWKKKYGRTFGLYEGYSPILRTTDADVIKQVFIKKFQSMTDRNGQFIMQENPRNWLLWSRGDLWNNQRALISPMFSASKMRLMMSTMSDCVERFSDQVNKRARSLKKNTFDKFDLSSLTLDVIASSFFGLKLNTYNADIRQDEFVKRAFKFADFDIIRFIIWLFVPRKLAAALKFDLLGPETYQYFYTLSQKIINQRRMQPKDASSKRQDVIQALIDAKLPETDEKVYTQLDDKEAHYSAAKNHQELAKDLRKQTAASKLFRGFSDLEICGQMTFMFIAGFETTASTLAFSLVVLANEPDVKEKVYKEMLDTFGEKGERFEDKQQRDEETTGDKYTSLLNLRQLDAFLSEVLRLYSPLIEHNRTVTDPQGVELTLDETRTLYLPRGVPVSVNGFVLQRDEEYFEEPNEFKMERFYSENREKYNKGAFMPFGLGPRYCAGMRFALLEIKVALTKILLNYDILPAKGSHYPPKFRQNAVFLQFENTNFNLVERA